MSRVNGQIGQISMLRVKRTDKNKYVFGGKYGKKG